MSLRDAQTAFMSSIFASDDTAVAAHLESADSHATKRMAIYRNNVYTALTKALEAIYPVIVRLVGDAFFKFAARHYINAYPSTSGDLNRFGAHFAQFLGSFEYAASLPYLPDVARLEWFCHQAYLAGDDPLLDLERLAAVAPQDYGRLQFRLNSACRLLHSVWPIAAIWRVNQPDYTGDQTVDLAMGGVSLLIQRHHHRIWLTPLSAAEWRFLTALNDKHSLEAAYESALHSDPDIDPGALLQQNVARAVLVEFFSQSERAMR